MVRLLGAFRRERNGLVADTMYYEGARYGLNYGVSLPTLRHLVREAEPAFDNTFAEFLLSQEVRCLRLAALHLVDPDSLQEPETALRWLDALTNSELAEEAAYALLSRSKAFDSLFADHLLSASYYPSYALLMAAARCPEPDLAWVESAWKALQRHPQRLMLQAVTSLWAHLANRSAQGKEVVLARLETLPAGPMADHLREELAWRILD